ncbi:putative pigment biosynthesis protein ayg1 [Rosellinia necatrix]|uniref:Putative pigment biosynthesis protein ayg1 n=1 Tax=Rosellinia necatrix TaxID=77044 RepID=A0A1W2TF18_ROSNE|nr:putative pigment biosynthesis protein ayg1 [Rosellinia necatrix]
MTAQEIPNTTTTTAAAAAAAAAKPPTRPAPETWQMGTAAFAQRMPHHAGIKALWETKWKVPCQRGVYPFHDGRYEDFAPIFEGLAARGPAGDDGYGAAYTEAFLSTAEALELEGDETAASGQIREASALYLRAACVLRIARFPYISAHVRYDDDDSGSSPSSGGYPAEVACPAKWRAWTAQKRVYMKAAARWADPVVEVDIPHVARGGRDGATIPAYVRVPQTHLSSESPGVSVSVSVSGGGGGGGQDGGFPTVLLLTGLDGYRPDNTGRCEEFLARGWAAVVAEIPGTADCPADPSDPAAADRLLASVLAWIAADRRLDARRVVCWGLSAGGYYAARAAHVHRARLAGAVAQGAGSHHFFDPAWLAAADGHEYPFRLLPALAAKHGFADVDAYLRRAQPTLSLLETGILDMPSTRLLLVNGTMDGLMPIEDSLLLLEHGSPKEARLFPGALHMGYPLANDSVYPWIEKIFASVK